MSDDIDISEYLKQVREHWVFSLAAFAIVFSFVASYTFFSLPVYEAKTLVLVSSQDQANFILGASAPKIGDLETQKIIIQSPNVMYPIYSQYGEQGFRSSLSTIKNSNVIEISVQADDAEKAAVIANSIAQSYLNHTSRLRKEEAVDTIDFITDKVQTIEKEIYLLDVRLMYYENSSSADELTVQNLDREIAAKSKIYDYLLTKREEAALAASLSGSNVKIIGYAEVPLSPIRPNKPLNIALGIILAAGAAVGTAVLADMSRKKRISDDLHKTKLKARQPGHRAEDHEGSKEQH